MRAHAGPRLHRQLRGSLNARQERGAERAGERASIEGVDENLQAAVVLFNNARFDEFQERLEEVAAATRAPSERQFYTSLARLAEALHQISVGDLVDAENILAPALRKLDAFVPRFRGLNVETLRDDFRAVLAELRDVREGKKGELHLKRLPRLRILPE